MPEPLGTIANLEGFQVPRVAIAQGMEARLVLAAFFTGKIP
jgi:hypothetical protein